MKDFFYPILFSLIFFQVDSLNLNGKEEGPCSIPKAQENIDAVWIQSVPLWYASGGSLYQLLRNTVGHKFFPYARDFKFFYGVCPTLALNFNSSTIATQGFGGTTGEYDFTNPSSGVFDLRSKSPVPGTGQHIKTVVITLTDNKTFCFTYQCWTQTNRRGWILYTIAPEVDEKVQKEIEAHAISLGFDRKQFQFLRREFCGDSRYRPSCNITA